MFGNCQSLPDDEWEPHYFLKVAKLVDDEPLAKVLQSAMFKLEHAQEGEEQECRDNLRAAVETAKTNHLTNKVPLGDKCPLFGQK